MSAFKPLGKLYSLQYLLLLSVLCASIAVEIHPVSTTISADVTTVSVIIPAPSLADGILGENEEQPCVVLLPASYEISNKEYPTIYFLHGGGANAYTYLSQFENDTIVKDVIIVLVNGEHDLLGNSYYANSPVIGNWEDYVVCDVVSYVDANFRTIDDSNFRGIAGFSLGGVAALTIAMKYPEMFGAAYGVAPSFFDENGLWESDFFIGDYTIAMVLGIFDALSDLNATEAHNQYVSLLSTSPALVALSYGSAFAPNLANGAPYFSYVYYRNAFGDIELNETAAEMWQNGWSGWDEKIVAYRQNLLSLRAIGIEYGYAEMPWLIDGCRYFSQVADAQGINLTVIKTSYPHILGTRVRDYMMPFFWEIFTVEPRPCVRVGSYQAKLLNEAFSVNITISDLDVDWECIGIEFRLRFNNTLLEVTNVSEGSFMKQFPSSPNTSANATLFINYVEEDDLEGYVLVGILLMPNMGDYPPEWSNYAYGNGTIATITFRAVYQFQTKLNLTPQILSSQLLLYQTKLITDEISDIHHWLEKGYYQITPSLLGDLNFDGMVDIADISIVTQAFGTTPSHSRWSDKADVNDDGTVDVSDIAIIIVKYGSSL